MTIDDLLIDIQNNGGADCICPNTTKDQSVCYFDQHGKLLFYLNKNCPVHGIGRHIYPPRQQPGSS